MKRNVRHFLRRVQYPLIAGLSFFPVILLVQAFCAPELVDRSWLLPAFYLALAGVNLFLWRKIRIPFALLGGAVMAYLCCREHTGVLRWILLGEGIFYAGLLFWSLPFGAWDENRELPVGFLGFGIGLYLFLLVLEKFFLSQENLLLEPIMPWLTYGLFAYLLLTVLSMNRRGLIQASTGRQRVPAAMRRKNLLMICLLLGGGGALALLPQVAAWVADAVKGFIGLLLRLLMAEADPNETIPPETQGGIGGPGLMDGLEPAPPVYIGVWFEYLGSALLVLAAATLLFMILRKLFRTLQKLFKAVGDRIRESGEICEDYEDEITDLRAEYSRARRERRENRDRWPMGDRGLSPGEKIRYRFRMLLRRHPEWNEGVTAREKLPEELAGLYEQVRYGDRTVSEQDAKNFQKETKKM